MYELASDYPEYRQHVAYLDLVPAFEITLQLLSPLTLFLIPDNGWQSRTINPDTVATDVLQNTIFSGLLSCKTLREMAGQQIESRNNRLWTLSVNEKNFPCLAAAGTFGVPVCITQCDLIGKNGVAHRLDAPLALPGVLADAPKSPAPTVDPPITPAPTPTPVPLWADFDFNMCLEALQVGDVDGDGALRRPEYYLFIKEYNRRKCLPPIGEFLTKDQIDLFNSLACQCLDQAEASSTCCLGTTAYIDLRGNLIADQDAYLEEVCRLTDQQLGATLCTPEPSMSPSVVPSMLTQPPASSADSTGGGPSDGSSSGSSGVGGKYYFLGMVSLLGVAAGGLFLS